ncbi:hypothetical protein TNCV_3066111 [Trichonephila clavipes]|uniref:Uncharacterized protein n=1 Tax=Trichonephila clavipes TaxID=2585209 RepID=A0A8X6V994_TRICX|nr:hypothetical protein TNCV_3066111 [Trichonephila clavipes]
MLVRRGPEDHLQPNCLRPRHIGPKPGVMIHGAISNDRSSPREIIDILPCHGRLPDLSLTEHIWDIIERQLHTIQS